LRWLGSRGWRQRFDASNAAGHLYVSGTDLGEGGRVRWLRRLLVFPTAHDQRKAEKQERKPITHSSASPSRNGVGVKDDSILPTRDPAELCRADIGGDTFDGAIGKAELHHAGVLTAV